MDILPLVMKGYQLGSYKLDDVSAEFINGTIYEIEYDETWVSDNIKGTSKTLAKFIAACASPSLLPPSPKYVITHKPFWALLYA